jgi:ATP/maltotriose-dependent transcriptional regulator MalT
MALLAAGRHREATAWADRGLRRARADLDASAMRAHGFVAVLCLVISGRYAEADRVLSPILALGEPSPLDRPAQLGLLALSALASVRRGEAAAGEQRHGEIVASPAAGSVLGRVAVAWTRAQLAACGGDLAKAARILTEHAAAMHAGGVDLWAAWSLLNAVEIDADDERIALATSWVTGMQSEYMAAHLAFLTAREQREVEALLAVVPRIHATGRPGLGVAAYRFAAERLRAGGDTAGAQLVDAEREAFIARLPQRAFDANRFLTMAVHLTGREREIARLVADGLTNPQIASRLVLSVRTVESHLHRIMRKTSTANRNELASYVRGLTA